MIFNWMLAAILVCGAGVFTSCTNDSEDNPAQEQAKKNRLEFVEHTRATMKDLAENLNFGSWTAANNFADENGYVSFVDLLDAQSVAYGINIVDHAAEPMQQSIIVVRLLLQYVQTLFGTYRQSQDE